MKKVLAILLMLLLVTGTVPFMSAAAAEEKGVPAEFAADQALYVHAVSDSADTEAWQAWQSVHDEDFNVEKPNEKYFFLPSSAASNTIDVYNGYDQAVTVNGVAIAAHGIYDFLLMIGSSPSQFSGLAFVAWIGLLIAGFYASNLCVDVLKAKDQAVAETKQAARKSDYRINVRR